jgi:DNA-binding response OmpR family regulator
MKILLLEDDVILNEIIHEYLLELNYEVISEFDGNDAIDTIYENHFDLLVLDVGVPGINGFELLKTLRNAKMNIPAIFITSLNDSTSLEEGFEAGCNDYIKKPFELKELEVRINNIKRINKIDSRDIMIINDAFKYDFFNRCLVKEDQKITLAKKETLILEFFLKNQHRTISVDELIVNIWEYEASPTNATIRTYIKNLRKCLGDNRIITEKGIGYRFES